MAKIILNWKKDYTTMITLMWLDILLVIMLVKTKVKTTRINVEG
jgi:hypothetical protein